MIWNEARESMEEEELRELQIRRLRQTVKWAYDRVPYYRELLQDSGAEPGDIRSLEDLQRLPLTSKEDLRKNYPYGLFAVPLDEVVRIHSSSGTTGKPAVVGYTASDIDVWAELMARTLCCGGVTKGDIVQVAYGYGLFTGGLGVHYGAERVGAAVIPVSGGNTRKQLSVMQDFGTTVLCCTPSYALYIAEVAAENGVDIRNTSLRVGFFGAEPWSDNMRQEIEAELGIDALDIYGLSEVIGPGVASECSAKNGLHIAEDHFIAEIVDPETGEVLADGRLGELVFTTLTKKAFPVLRYRTRDITCLRHGSCECGRTLVRMDRVSGRTDDMLIIRGVNVFPSQIESVLLSIGDTEPHYQLVVDRRGRLDDLEVWVEVSEGLFSDEVRRLEELEARVKGEIEATLGISVGVKLVEPRTIARSEGKARRVIDRREL